MSDGWEVEQKYVIHDVADFLKRLSDNSFVETGVEHHRDTYFRHPCRNFRETDEAFRLRQVDDQACVTYKGKRLELEVKTRPEIELEIQSKDFDSWLQMMQHLGFTTVPSVVKKRTCFSNPSPELAEFTVTHDEVEELGSFAEIELLIHEEAKLAHAANAISELGERLGLTEIQPLSYLAQLLSLKGLE